MNIVLKAKIINNSIIWDNKDLAFKALGEKEGQVVSVVIKKPGSKRSIMQNRYYWLILGMISDYTGDDINYLHWCFRSKFLTSFKQNKISEKDEAYTPSTTKLNTVQFEKYLENIRRWAILFIDLYIPKPNEVELDNIYVNYQE